MIPVPSGNTLFEVLQMRVESSPDELAFCFLIDGETEGPRLTFAGLFRQASRIAAELRRVTGVGERALLLYEPGLEFIPAFFGCLAAGVMAVPVSSPRLNPVGAGLEPFAAIAADCSPQAILSDASTMARHRKATEGLPIFADVKWIATDALDATGSTKFAVHSNPNAVAFLQYTSGATGDPKGVMVTHRNLMHNEEMMRVAFAHMDITTGLGVCWLPLHHDMGLIGSVLQSLYVGCPHMIMSPIHLLQRPFRWLNAISKYRADSSGGPNFAFALCTERITEDERAALDLSNWSIAAIGAEPVQPDVIEDFARTFAPCGFRREAFYPCYGLAEATLFVTGGRKHEPPVARVRPACESDCAEESPIVLGAGQTWLDQEVVIVNPATCRTCPDREVGEIWVRGPSVAAGYWNRPEETRETFGAHLADGEGPYLRTGDLGFLEDGELFVTGRTKDVIIVRGRNHYPQDIEDTVQSLHEAFRRGRGAAFGVRQDGEERLVVVQEIDRKSRRMDLPAVERQIRQAVAERHGLELHEVAFVRNGAVPRTTSGKVRRNDCRTQYLEGTLALWQPKSP